MSDPTPESSAHAHRRSAPGSLRAAVITVSDTRNLETDSGGQKVTELLEGAGHVVVAREIVKDESSEIAQALARALAQPDLRAVVLTGGTGVAARDVTPEAIAPLLEREIPGFGELFRMLSFAEIGSAALLSRATAGIAGGAVVFALPGSRGAIQLAMERLILPELGHLAAEALKGR